MSEDEAYEVLSTRSSSFEDKSQAVEVRQYRIKFSYFSFKGS